MFDYLTKFSIINLKEFTVDSINNFGWELDFSIRLERFLNHVNTVSMSTNVWKILSWKKAYAMLLANNTKWASSQLFGCGRAKLGLLAKGHLHRLMFITKLLLVWPLRHTHQKVQFLF